MVHVIFDTSSVGYDDFIQTGGNAPENIVGGETEKSLNFFKGSQPFQRGYGIQGGAGVGDVFRGIWRFFLPLLRRVGTTVSQEALNTGQRVLDKVVNEGESLKSAVVNEGKKGIDTVLAQGGLPKQFGTGKKGIKRKSITKNSIIPPHQTIIGRTVNKPAAKKRIRSDAFGLF